MTSIKKNLLLIIVFLFLPFSLFCMEKPVILPEKMTDNSANAGKKLVIKWKRHKQLLCVEEVKFSPDGQRVITSAKMDSNFGQGRDYQLVLWKKYGATFKRVKSLQGHYNGVNSVKFSPDSTQIISGAEGDFDNLILWDGKKGKEIRKLEGHYTDIIEVKFSKDGKMIASGSCSVEKKWKDKVIKDNLIVWDSETGKKRMACEAHPGGTSLLRFSPDGKRLLSGSCGVTFSGDTESSRDLRLKFSHLESKKKNLALWDNEKCTKIADLEGHNNGVLCAKFNHDGSLIISGSKGGVIAHDGKTGKKLRVFDGHAFNYNLKKYQLPVSLIKFISGPFFVSASHVTNRFYTKDGSPQHNYLILWDSTTGKPIANLKGHEKGINVVKVSPDKKIIATGSDGDSYNLILWDSKTGKPITALHGHDNDVLDLEFSKNGKFLISGSRCRPKVYEDDESESESKNILDVLESSSDSSSFEQEEIRNNSILWDVENLKKIKVLKNNTGNVVSVSFSPQDNNMFVSGSDDCGVEKFERCWFKELLAPDDSPKVRNVVFSNIVYKKNKDSSSSTSSSES